MEENKNSNEYGTHWAENLLSACQKNRREMVRDKQFGNPV